MLIDWFCSADSMNIDHILSYSPMSFISVRFAVIAQKYCAYTSINIKKIPSGSKYGIISL